MSTSQIQEAVLAERARCVAIITTIADEMRADAVRADNEGKQITREAYEHTERLIRIVARAVGRDP